MKLTKKEKEEIEKINQKGITSYRELAKELLENDILRKSIIRGYYISYFIAIKNKIKNIFTKNE